ncbi:MAG: DUF3461 family protein [Gammaproteobacteria bacterium]|nr:DUF3461 family protein [Gammaproteobacteria bacterium]
MKSYPRLEEMGVTHPQQIEKFSIYSTDNVDVLHIIYQRQKGSLLPVSRKYKFSRIKKSVLVDSGTRQTEVVFESSDAFREALHELEGIKAARSDNADLAALISEEIRLLEEDISLRTEYIKSLVSRI